MSECKYCEVDPKVDCKFCTTNLTKILAELEKECEKSMLITCCGGCREWTKDFLEKTIRQIASEIPKEYEGNCGDDCYSILEEKVEKYTEDLIK